MRRRSVMVLPLCLAALVTPAAAGPWKTLTTEDGLPNNEVQFIEQDSRGTVWIGTLGGLATYEGGKIGSTPIKAKAWDVLRTGKDTYWVGTAKGVVHVKGEETQRSLKGKTVAPIVPFGEGDKLLALAKDPNTERSAMMVRSEGAWSPVEKLAGMHANDMVKLPNGQVWVGVEGNGVYVFEPNAGIEDPAHHHEGLSVTTVRQTGDGRVWVGLWDRGLAVYQNGEWERHLSGKQMYIFAIRRAADGAVYAATDQRGLWRYDGEEWTNLLAEEGAVNMLETTRDGRVWVSTQQTGGLRYRKGGQWHTSIPGPLPIRCLTRLEDGTLLAGGVLDGVHVRPAK